VRPGKRPENTFLSKRVIANGTMQANRKNNWLPIFPQFYSSFSFPCFFLFSVYPLILSCICFVWSVRSIGTFPFLYSILVFSFYPLDERQILSWQASRNKVTTNSRWELLDCALTFQTTNSVGKPFLFIPLITYSNRKVYQITEFS